MSKKLRSKLRALHAPRPSERPEPDATQRAAPTAAPDEGAPRLDEDPAPRTQSAASSGLPPRLEGALEGAPGPAQERPAAGRETVKVVRAHAFEAWRARRRAGEEPTQAPAAASETRAEAARAKAAPRPPVRRARGERAARAAHLSELTEGRVVRRGAASCWVARARYADTDRWGRAPLGEARSAHTRVGVSAPEGLLFLDLETTGLSAKRGDHIFLAGLGAWDDAGFCVDVYCVHHPAEEALAVALVLERLRAAESLVTFNGKTFDLPFLRARAEAHGLSMPEVEHVDLLAIARKRKHRAARGGLRLQQLEVDLLGLKREGDIPGREAPRRYAEYLEREDATRIHPLLVHNVDDIVSMAPLLGHLTGDEPSAPEASAEVLWDRARLAAHAGRLPEAAAFYDAAVDAEIDPRRAREARRAAARIYERLEDTDTAIARWLEVVAPPSSDPEAHLQLATLYEARGEHEKAAEQRAIAKRLAPFLS